MISRKAEASKAVSDLEQQLAEKRRWESSRDDAAKTKRDCDTIDLKIAALVISVSDAALDSRSTVISVFRTGSEGSFSGPTYGVLFGAAGTGPPRVCGRCLCASRGSGSRGRQI